MKCLGHWLVITNTYMIIEWVCTPVLSNFSHSSNSDPQLGFFLIRSITFSRIRLNFLNSLKFVSPSRWNFNDKLLSSSVWFEPEKMFDLKMGTMRVLTVAFAQHKSSLNKNCGKRICWDPVLITLDHFLYVLFWTKSLGTELMKQWSRKNRTRL